MALTAQQTFYVRKSGVETSGGGFDPSLTAGMLTNGAATSANTSAPVFSSASYNFVAGDAGKWLYIASGTNWIPGYYLIASVASNNATLGVACATTASPTNATFTVNYADQDAPQLSLTDLTSTASTTVTSAAALFTPVMVGNMIRLASATGSPVADSAGSRYIAIVTYTDTSNVVVDKTSGTYTLGIAKLGGAHATLVNHSNGGVGLATPALTSPLAAGHTVYMRSAGSAVDPSIAGTLDYDYSAGYWQFVAGSSTVGRIRFVGMGASEAVQAAWVVPAFKPLIKTSGLLFYGATLSKYWNVTNIKSFHVASASTTAYGLIAGAAHSSAEFCIHDVNGNDAAAFFGTGAGADYAHVNSCWVKNTGGGAAGSIGAIGLVNVSPGFIVMNTLVTDVRGIGINVGNLSKVIGCVVANAGSHGFKSAPSLIFNQLLLENTAYNCGGDGFNLTQLALLTTRIQNNTSSKIPSGKFAFNVSDGTLAANNAVRVMFDYNNAFLDSGAGGLYNNATAGLHDTNVDPTFTNTSTYDFSVGTNLKAKGIGIIGNTISYVDIGASQRQEADGAANPVGHQST